jgi:UDP-N-acetylmuramate--alanine ligase
MKVKKTIAVGGTSGKSTTTAMLFAILEYAGMQPSIISGAGLTSIIKEEKIGNAKWEKEIGWLLKQMKAMAQ